MVFNNRLTPLLGARVTFSDGTPVGAGFAAQLYAGPVGTPVESLSPVVPTATFRLTSTLAMGYVVPVEVAVPGVPPFEEAALQMRVFDGLTWESSIIRGESNPITVRLSSLVDPAANLIGLQPFQVNAIPEPGTTTLLVVGVASVFAFCRARRCGRAAHRLSPGTGQRGTDGDYDGPTVDRLGVGWFKMKIKTDNTLSLNRPTDGREQRPYPASPFMNLRERGRWTRLGGRLDFVRKGCQRWDPAPASALV